MIVMAALLISIGSDGISALQLFTFLTAVPDLLLLLWNTAQMPVA